MEIENIKKLGFGLMRLPRSGSGIDLAQVKEMVDRFMAAGFTYFDTAWAYPGSEDAIRQALVERYPRESFQLATKNAAWIGCKTREEAVAQFDTSLRQTGAGYFDFYLLHNLGEHRTHYFDDFDLWNFVQEKKREGLIRHDDQRRPPPAEAAAVFLSGRPQGYDFPLQKRYYNAISRRTRTNQKAACITFVLLSAFCRAKTPCTGVRRPSALPSPADFLGYLKSFV